MGYKDLMENYQIVVSNLATERGEKDTNLVLNLFQSLLDEFTRGYTKNDFEPVKVGSPARHAHPCLAMITYTKPTWHATPTHALPIPRPPCHAMITYTMLTCALP